MKKNLNIAKNWGGMIVLLIQLASCTHNPDDEGKHFCSDGLHEYRLNIFTNGIRVAQEREILKATDVFYDISSNQKLNVYYKINLIPQVTPEIRFSSTDKKINANYLVETKLNDPSTGKDWIRIRNYKVSIDKVTGKLERLIEENHLNLDSNLTSSETFELTAKCN